MAQHKESVQTGNPRGVKIAMLSTAHLLGDALQLPAAEPAKM